MNERIALLIIDPQLDFCDSRGALSVPGADADMQRLAAMIRRLKDRITDIHITLDSHHLVHIAHPIFWRDREGLHPPVFTTISHTEVAQGIWTTTQPEWHERALAYVRKLAENGRYELTIWPPHCLIGSPGHAVFPALFAALQEWEQRYAVVNFVLKGSNLMTEHYSAVQADVPDPHDPGTQLNKDLIRQLAQADIIAIAGEARTHCVANTVRDIVNSFKPEEVSKLVLLADAMSDIPGFELYAQSFMADMAARGVKVATTEDFLN